MRLILAIAAFATLGTQAQADCRSVAHGQGSYTVCDYDISTEQIALYNLDSSGKPYLGFSTLRAALAQQGRKLTFAMNAGMYGTDYKPIGLYVEGGKRLRKLNRANGAGNFHLKPNGVFYIAGGKAGVLDSESFAKSGLKPDYATQSGPMLVINGAVHPRISPNGTSAKTRNGVCVTDERMVHFAISDDPVTFYDFASLFLENLNCDNALFLDGSVSALYSTTLNRDDQVVPLGPMVGVTEPLK